MSCVSLFQTCTDPCKDGLKCKPNCEVSQVNQEEEEKLGDVNIVAGIKAEAEAMNIFVYVFTVVALFLMIAYAVMITYKNGKLSKMVEKGKETLATISNLDLNPASSLIAIGQTIKRKTMDKINNTHKDGEKLVTEDPEI